MVSISMSPAADTMRSESARKRSAEIAYTRHADFAAGNETKRSEVAKQLAADPAPSRQAEEKAFQKLGAGQLKQVALPLGETLEETIASWRNVRREALSESDPSQVDHQLAAAASAKIMEAEAQLALEDRLRSLQLSEASQETVSAAPERTGMSVSEELNSLYTEAAEAYAFQANAKERGYNVALPGFFMIA